jgi:hypothetical protein
MKTKYVLVRAMDFQTFDTVKMTAIQARNRNAELFFDHTWTSLQWIAKKIYEDKMKDIEEGQAKAEENAIQHMEYLANAKDDSSI